MINGHLPHHMAWVAYKLQLWAGLCYGLGTMTNNIKEAASMLNETDYKILNVFGSGSHSDKRPSKAAHDLWRIRPT
jgi:hypothetical protein